MAGRFRRSDRPGWLRAALTAADLGHHGACLGVGVRRPSSLPEAAHRRCGNVGGLVAGWSRSSRDALIYDEPDVRLGEGDLQFAGDVEHARVAYLAARGTLSSRQR